MARVDEKRLLDVIINDDAAAFNALNGQARLEKYRLGRFPVLSLMYLFSSKKILAEHEKEFIAVSSQWESFCAAEPASVLALFSKKAGKCLRLYFDAVVTPIEMLLILDKTNKVKKLYPLVGVTDEVKSRLKAIYYIKYSLGIEFKDNGVLIDRKPLSRSEKKKIAVAVSAAALVAAVSVVTPVSVVSYLNKYGIAVSSAEQIDFTKQRTYALKSDVVIPRNYSVKSTACNIIGGGHKLVLEGGASLGNFSGSMSNLTVETQGAPIFTSCSGRAVLKDITVSVSADLDIKSDHAFVTVNNYGTLDGITVNVEGTVRASSKDEGEELVLGGVAAYNAYSNSSTYGKIKNCKVNYTSFYLEGEKTVNASFGGIAGVNNGTVEDSVVSGSVEADTFDIAGACYVNNSSLTRIESAVNLSQKSENEEWSPLVAGVVNENGGLVEYCKSTGSLSVTGADFAICGGIAGQSYGRTAYCYSSGDITVTAEYAYVGGIYGMSRTASDNFYVYLGFADHCLSESKIYASLGEGNSCVGGIGGLVQQLNLYGTFYGGGVTNSIYLGEISGEFNYRGSVVGVCGANVYEANSYMSGDEEVVNFEGNYFLEGSGTSFGAKATTDEIFLRVDGKGATAAPLTEIKQTDVYKEIIEKLEPIKMKN